jgi:hypothetical protein
MGYYAESSEAKFIIKEDKVQAAFAELNEWRELFPEQARWFYFGNAETLQEVLENLGFGTEEDNGDISIYNFDSKWHNQTTILTVLKDFVAPDSYMSFVGEDHTMWQWTPEGVKEGRIIWV